MAPPLDLQKLLKEPFGPYYEDKILNTNFSIGKTLDLTSVTFECAGSPIGLDETEFIVSAPENSKVARNAVYFFGKLKVASLEWLTPEGKKWLEADLRKRDEDIHLNGETSGLTLARLYGNLRNEGSRITILIGCEKSMQARFIVPKDPTLGLVLHSRHNKRYRVVSLDVGIFQKSQNFLARYRLWALINEMIDNDKVHTPVEDRTIDWLVKTYLRRFRARRTTDLYHRHIFDPNDSDVDSDGNTSTPRHLRHIPRAEIRGHFAAHAEWILAQMVAPDSSSQYKLNVSKWIAFCKQVKEERRDASSSGIQWGIPYGGDRTVQKDKRGLDLTQFGKTADYWAKKIKRATKAQAKPVTVRQASPVSVDDGVNRRRVVRPPPVYDWPTPPPSETDSGADSDEPPLPSLATRIPPYCLKAPEIPRGRFEWKCPGCSYKIDLLNITEDNTQNLTKDFADALRAKEWTYLDEGPIQLAFFLMVSNHYKMHMRQNGVHVVQKGQEYRVEQWPPKPIPRATRSKTVAVKVEDGHTDLALRS